jgi:hypothetical protein
MGECAKIDDDLIELMLPRHRRKPHGWVRGKGSEKLPQESGVVPTTRASYNGITLASQASDEGSTPFARSRLLNFHVSVSNGSHRWQADPEIHGFPSALHETAVETPQNGDKSTSD